MTQPEKIIVATFYQLPIGRESVREWLWKLDRADRQIIGRDLRKVEFGWPCGKPLCAQMIGYPGLWEVRSDITSKRIARVLFYVNGPEMVVLHGFIKKTQKTPEKDKKLANRRMKEHQRHGTQKS